MQEFYATNTQAPPAALIFSVADRLKNFALTMSGWSGRCPFPSTLQQPQKQNIHIILQTNLEAYTGMSKKASLNFILIKIPCLQSSFRHFVTSFQPSWRPHGIQRNQFGIWSKNGPFNHAEFRTYPYILTKTTHPTRLSSIWR